MAPDVVIIGAGVFGAAIAFSLAERREGRVLLLERERVAAGATGVSSAIVRVHYTNPWEARLALTSLGIFRGWTDRVGGTCGYRRTGFLRIVGTGDRDHLRRNVEMLRELGANVEFLETDDLERLQPALSVEGVGAAAYEPDGGYADGTDTAAAFIRAATERGVVVRHGVAATAVRLRGDRAEGVETSTGFIAAGQVVVAAGSWSAALLADAGVPLPIRTKLIRAGLVQHAPDDQVEHMTVIDDGIGTYFRPEGHGRTEFGLRYEWDVTPGYGPVPVPLAYVADGAQRVAARVPALLQAGLVRGWAAPDGFSPDGAPILGPVPGITGLYVAAAASGTGFKIAPAVGIGMAELVTLSRGGSVDLTPFRAERFAEDAPMSSPTDYRRPPWRHESLP